MPSLTPLLTYLHSHVILCTRFKFLPLQVSVNPLLESCWWPGGFRVLLVVFLDFVGGSNEVFGGVPSVIRVCTAPAYLVLKSASVGAAGEDLVHSPFRFTINGDWGLGFLELSRQRVVWVLSKAVCMEHITHFHAYWEIQFIAVTFHASDTKWACKLVVQFDAQSAGCPSFACDVNGVTYCEVRLSAGFISLGRHLLLRGLEVLLCHLYHLVVALRILLGLFPCHLLSW